MSKNKQAKKPVESIVTLDMGKAVTISGFSMTSEGLALISPDGTQCQPATVRYERISMRGENRPKVLSSIKVGDYTRCCISCQYM